MNEKIEFLKGFGIKFVSWGDSVRDFGLKRVLKKWYRQWSGFSLKDSVDLCQELGLVRYKGRSLKQEVRVYGGGLGLDRVLGFEVQWQLEYCGLGDIRFFLGMRKLLEFFKYISRGFLRGKIGFFFSMKFGILSRI